ncbi:MAG: glycoside hydrolase family 3 N-terminal domain-containing protein [Acidobacteriota bacterium]
MKSESLNSLSLEEKIGQLFVIGLPGPDLDEKTLRLLDDVRPGGVCLFSRNIRDAEQTRALLDGIRGSMSVEPILSIDQEGGLVDRLRRLVSPMPSASDLRTAVDAKRLGEIVAECLRIIGFNVDFAPVVDVANESRSAANNGIFSRTFGGSANEVVELAGAFLSALEAGGCLGCLKHFPGLGASAVDSHEELPIVEVALDELYEIDLFPYRSLINSARSVMVAHAAYPNVALQETDQNGKLLPSSLSYAFVTKLLRDEMGFDGLSVTDDLEMGAILKNYGIGDACRLAVSAGQDILAICADPGRIREGYHAVLSAVKVGEISEARLNKSLDRICEFKSRLSPALDFDTSRLVSLSAEVDQLKESLK